MTTTRIPTHLRDQLRACKVIPFVGAGVSRAVRDTHGQELFPSWGELLKRGADRIKDDEPDVANFIRAALKLPNPDYQQIADQLRGVMVGSVWMDFLNEQINPRFQHVETSSLALARAVWQLGSPLIITTNYDRVLDWACPEPQDLRTLGNTAVAELARLIHESTSKPNVWHLHGRIDNIDNMVLTTDSYRILYGSQVEESEYRAAQAALAHQLAGPTILFIGFSLDDTYIAAQMRGVFQLFKGYASTPYALIPKCDSERVQADIRHADLPVTVIPYADFGQPLLDLVQQLAAHVARK